MPIQSISTITGIDTHAHIFHPDLPMVADRRYAPDYTATVEDYISQLDNAGLSHSVLIQPSFLGTDNSYIEKALHSIPDRLRAIAVVDTTISEKELTRMTRLGFVGTRFNLVGQQIPDYSTSDWQFFFKRLEAYNWQIEIQRPIEDLTDFIPVIAQSGLPVVIDHFGLPKGGVNADNPVHKAFLHCLEDYPNIWLKLSAPYRARLSLEQAQHSLTLLQQACGGFSRFIWGSDWPHTRYEPQETYQRQITFLYQLLPDAKIRRRVLTDNPATLFHIV